MNEYTWDVTPQGQQIEVWSKANKKWFRAHIREGMLLIGTSWEHIDKVVMSRYPKWRELT